ncbi:GntR family transcriptional regulator [Kineococcus glutinatus]|uniref:GntR family transcriptional regulator n=1 Tax=Kineococcus glutinatus TaxID=1070872 RepID=A0ABP9HN96_9ACTN
MPAQPLVALDADSTVPPYEQVRSQVLGAVRTGRLVPGDRLPPVRALAAELGLAANTVARAYRELEQAGAVETRGRAGTVVTAGGEVLREEAARRAAEYAQAVTALGIGADDALALVRAALTRTAAG